MVVVVVVVVVTGGEATGTVAAVAANVHIGYGIDGGTECRCT